MILPDEHQKRLLEIKDAIDKAVEANNLEELLKNLAFVAVKSDQLWDRIVGNEPVSSCECHSFSEQSR